MKYIFIVMIAIALAGSWYWWQTPVQTVPVESTTVPIVASATQATSTTKTGESNIYRNERWGISFEYPKDWEIKENEINTNSSLFNIVIQKNNPEALPRPIYILFSSEEWGRRLVEKYYNPKSDSKKIVGNIEAYTFSSSDMGMPTKVHLLPVNEVYWVNVVGKTGYEAELSQVLESLTITPVDTEN